MTKAKGIWGTDAALGRFRRFGAVGWTYQVGCVLTGGSGAFIVAGSAPGSWDAAFSVVDMNANGPHIITAVATDSAGNTAKDSIQVFACNPPAAAKL
jgi:hypothetical protein